MGATNKESGHLSPQLNSYDVSLLSDVMSYFGRYISRVDKTESWRQESAQITRKQIKNYLAGGNSTTSILNAGGDNLVLNLSAFEQVLDSVSGNQAEAANLLSAGIAVGIYSRLSKEMTEKFSGLIGNKANISKMSFFRAYGQKIDNPVQRRKLACRTFFVSEFNKYIAEQSDNEMHDFFENIN